MPGRPASPRPARAASPRMARASPATPKAKAISVGVTPGSSKSLHASGKRPPTATKKKAATSKPKAKKALNVNHGAHRDGDVVGQSNDQPLVPTGASAEEEVEVMADEVVPKPTALSVPTSPGTEEEEDEEEDDEEEGEEENADGIAPDAAAFLAEALLSFRAPPSHRGIPPPMAVAAPARTTSSTSSSSSAVPAATVYRKLYNPASTQSSSESPNDDAESVLSSSFGSIQRLAPPPPVSILAPPPPIAAMPPPPPTKNGDVAMPTMLAAALSQISGGLESHRLRHVHERHDRSGPLIEPNTGLKLSLAPKLFAELSAGLESHRLRHVEQVNDRSAPLIEDDVKLRPSAHKNLVNEIKTKKGFIESFIHRRSRLQTTNEVLSAIAANPTARLRKPSEVNDRSTPLIEKGLSVKRSAAPQLFAQLAAAATAPTLRHVEQINDRSAPIIDCEVRIKRSAAPQLFDELKKKVTSFFGGA